MRSNFRLCDLIPPALTAETVSQDADTIIVAARYVAPSRSCPQCGTSSSRIHSRYGRTVCDLPCCGRRVELRITARRFFCIAPLCRQRIFTECFGDDVLPTGARRTGRLECLVHHLGLALGCRPASSFARRLMLPVSNDTLLRVVRRRARQPVEPLTVAGVDDWAFRRNSRYGTIVCNLERHRVVKLLPDREIATVAAFLTDHRTIKVLSRDRGGDYGEAAFVPQPVEHPLGRVALLARHLSVLVESMIDRRNKRIQLRPAHRRLPSKAGWRRIRQHLANTVARYVEVLRRRALRHPFRARQTDLQIQFHGIDPLILLHSLQKENR